MKYAFVISLAMISYFLATDIYTPSMPEIARYFNESSDEVQKTISYFLLGGVLSCLVAGIYADHWGKKKFMLFGLVLATIGSVMTIFCPSLDWLIFGRFMQGLGGGVGPVIGYSAIQELYDEKQQAKIYGMLGVSAAGVPALAPFMGGVISTYWGWHWNFVIIMGLFAISFICVWLYLPSSMNKKSTHSGLEILKSYKDILSSKAFLALALISPLYNSVEWFYLTFLPFYTQDRIGISAELYGIVIGVLISWFAAGSYLGSKLIIAYGVHKTILVGLYAGLISGLMLWATSIFMPMSAIFICVSLSVFLLGFGILFPSSVNSSLNVFKEGSTRASSIRSLFIISFAYIGSFSAELVDESNLSSFAMYVLLCAVLSFGVYSLRARNVVKG